MKYHTWEYPPRGNRQYCGLMTLRELKRLARERGLDICEAFYPGDYELCTPERPGQLASIMFDATPEGALSMAEVFARTRLQ